MIKDQYFPSDPHRALLNGFDIAEKKFMAKAYNKETGEIDDRSGSCAIVVLIVGEKCYVANVGDSRALLSTHSGQRVVGLSRDHKPEDPIEKERVLHAGG